MQNKIAQIKIQKKYIVIIIYYNICHVFDIIMLLTHKCPTLQL